MPKLRTNRGARKRFRVTGKGKILRSHAYAAHILTSKTRKRKRKLSKSALVSAEDKGRVRRMLNV
ncbi:MAG: 50S ribosomal protein L35 [Candidatus Eisenbacteria bacterium]|nr:50S ribosomal protein L35 [Candidatus Eisenbacteria bacterium]